MLITTWEYVEWRRFSDSDPRRYLANYDTVYEPMPMQITLPQAYLFWFCCCSFPYYISQLIFIVIVSLSLMLRDSCEQINLDITALREQMEDVHAFGKHTPIGKKILDDVEERVSVLRRMHLEVVLCCESVNKMFGWILCAIYVFSLAVACSFIAAAVSNTDKLAITAVLNVGSVVLFGSYAILFMIPLAQVHEQDSKLPLRLYRLTDQLQYLPMHTRVFADLNLFSSACQKFNVSLCAAELIHFNRGLLTWTVTFLVSAAFLAHEVVSRAEDSLIEYPNTVAKNLTLP
ncbi:uncharacterized protein LOC129594854 [Paramacrobiotus metropolitanus]|uniref:uncharacterized protein LOC129594854 n=1 Tax=Paramacrobiotus metropolitanus TaxID=2943436 RepID=UPI002445906A|nr:uncharacterized protein LOC129594854 [Paramacrobiotus metropolitanus]